MEENRRYGEREKAKAVELYHRLQSFKAVCALTGISRKTVKRWVEEYGDAKVFRMEGSGCGEAMGEEGAGGEARCLDEVRNSMLQLLWRQIQSAICQQDELEKLLDAVREDGDTPQKERVETAKALAKMARPEMKEITSSLLALYDRQTEGEEESVPDLSRLSAEQIRALIDRCDKK